MRLWRPLRDPTAWFALGLVLAAFLLLGLRTIPWMSAVDVCVGLLERASAAAPAGSLGRLWSGTLQGLEAIIGGVSFAVSILALFHAVGLLWGSVIGLWCCQRSGRAKQTGLLALVVALGGNGIIAAISSTFFTIAEGSSIRPMAEGVWVMMASLYTVAAVGALSVHSVWRERVWVWPALAIPIAVESFFLGGQLLNYAAALRHFELAE